MPLELADYEKLAKKAVRHFWMSRASARTRQQANGLATRLAGIALVGFGLKLAANNR